MDGVNCSCGDWDGEGVGFHESEDYINFQGIGKHNQRKRCCSCKDLISIGDTCIEFKRFRYPDQDNEIECNIYPDDYEIPLATWFMCEKCGDTYCALISMGHCFGIDSNMQEELKEYRWDREEDLEMKEGG